MSIYNVFRKFQKFRLSMSIYNVLYTDSNRIYSNHPDTSRSKTIANCEVYDTTQPVETRSGYLLINFDSVPWVGLIVALTWSIYSLLRKKISVESDIGLLIESLYITPLALLIFYLITIDGNYYFSLDNPKIAFWLFLAGPMTVIPLFLFLKGVDLAGLGTSGMVFFITPTCQFLLGAFYYNEYFDLNKLIGFIIIWIAVAIYLHDLSREKIRN